jgi:hypothetical protein
MSSALTVVAEIDPGRRALLEERLAAIATDLALPASLPDTHFTRFVIVDDAAKELAPLLVWESNHDGETLAYLAACARPGLDEIFECCLAYPPGLSREPETFAAWMKAHALRAEAFYCAYPGVSRAQVLNDRKVRDAIRAYVDAHRPELARLPMVEIQNRIRAHVRTLGLDDSVQGDGLLTYKVKQIAAYVAGGLIALVALPVVPLLWWKLRRKERTDVADAIDRPVHGNTAHIAAEDHVRQNQLTHLVDLKPGAFRYWLLRTVLLAIDRLARYEYVHGHLGGITTIHFARWVLLHDRRKNPPRRRHRLIFFSNYDGSWDAYLGEFIDRAADGLTAVWSNTEGFPRTEKLLGAGARDEEAFKQWARNRQIPTQVWWSGVPDAAVDNVRTDVWVRRRLGRQLSDTELPEWLKKL